MQSWGLGSRFDERDTGSEPSKSGVVGLLAAAQGRRRGESVEDLASLRMGVRVDREGVLRYDYQTAQDVAKADGSGRESAVTRRYYLADAVFLVGLEGPREILAAAEAALRNPRWPPSLGRRSYVPSRPLWLPDGLRDEPLEDALATCAFLGQPMPCPRQVRYVLEAGALTGGALRMDQPLGPFEERRFGGRTVTVSVRPWGEVPR